MLHYLCDLTSCTSRSCSRCLVGHCTIPCYVCNWVGAQTPWLPRSTNSKLRGLLPRLPFPWDAALYSRCLFRFIFRTVAEKILVERVVGRPPYPKDQTPCQLGSTCKRMPRDHLGVCFWQQIMLQSLFGEQALAKTPKFSIKMRMRLLFLRKHELF